MESAACATLFCQCRLVICSDTRSLASRLAVLDSRITPMREGKPMSASDFDPQVATLKQRVEALQQQVTADFAQRAAVRQETFTALYRILEELAVADETLRRQHAEWVNAHQAMAAECQLSQIPLDQRQGETPLPQTSPGGDVVQELLGDFPEIVGQSPAMQDLFSLIKLVANSHATVLILGESGTGKELVARALHHHSPRRARPFVAIDCGGLPESLLESELFGYMKGAFTGAISNKKGLFEEANGGTLLLDEIGDTSLIFQSKLLRVLQEGDIRPVGNTKNIKVDVRVIAATNKSLKRRVEEKTFREELYYRLAVVPVVIPPLRQRQEDIPLLVDHFVRKYCAQNHMALKRVSSQALRLLYGYSWPGNVRELEHVIERAVLLSPGADIGPEACFPHQAQEEYPHPLQRTTRTTIETVERERIVQAIQKAHGNRSQAARLLHISRATLYNKLKRYCLAG